MKSVTIRINFSPVFKNLYKKDNENDCIYT